MALRTLIAPRVMIIPVCLFLLLALNSLAHAGDRSISTNLGRISLPEFWQVEQVSQEHITAWSDRDSVRLARMGAPGTAF